MSNARLVDVSVKPIHAGVFRNLMNYYAKTKASVTVEYAARMDPYLSAISKWEVEGELQ